MCGLYGFFDLDLPDRKQRGELFRQLARKAQIRGVDSWGVAYSHKQRARLQHGLGPISKRLARDNKLQRSVSASKTLLGHTRAASRGEVALRNAHPFKVGDYIGCHNGTLSGTSSMVAAAQYAPAGETDSEESLGWLVTEGLTAESFAALQGWYAWTILKADLTELLVVVDSKTPFAIARVGDGIVWHSLAEALDSSLRAVGLKADVQEIRSQILRFPGGDVVDLAAPAAVPAVSRTPRICAEDDGIPEMMIDREDQFAMEFEFGGEA